MISLRDGRYGKSTMIVGPVLSGKTTHLERLLNSAAGIIWDSDKDDSRIVLAKHPHDDVSSPKKIAGYSALETADPDKIADLVTKKTEAVVIAGINFFEDRKIVDLVHDLVMSNRRVYATGHNLDWEGKPFNFMPELMAVSDDFIITKAPCMVEGCQLTATRSEKVKSKGERRCIKHHSFDGRPDHKHFLIDQLGGLELFVGGMYASKTTTWSWKMDELKAKGLDYEVFKWLSDTRYSERGKQYSSFDTGVIGLNNHSKKIPAVLVRDIHDVLMYIEGRTPNKSLNEKIKQRRIGHIFIDEGQFISGIYEEVKTRVYQGFRFYVSGLLRTYKLEPFGDIAKLLAMADEINVMQAYCDVCGRAASDSQRLIKQHGKWMPSDYRGENIAVGGKEKAEEVPVRYGARCKDCIDIPGMPESRYSFPRYDTPKTKKDWVASMK